MGSARNSPRKRWKPRSLSAFAHFDRTQATARNLMLAFALIAAISLCARLVLHVALPDVPARAHPFHGDRADGSWSAGLGLEHRRGAAGVQGGCPSAVQLFARSPFYLVLSLTLSARCRDGLRSSRRISTAAPPISWNTRGRSPMESKYAAQETARRRRRARGSSGGAARGRSASRFSRTRSASSPRAIPPRANVYTIGVAGWGYQDVFLKEIRQSTDILKNHFHLGERTLNLINNAATAHEAPMASMPNLGEALRAVSHHMDRDKDLLVLVLSSHGSRDGVALSYQGSRRPHARPRDPADDARRRRRSRTASSSSRPATPAPSSRR